MNPNVEERRRQMLELLEKIRGETRAALSALDPERVVHTDERGWRVRDVLGHLGVWNGEAALSLSAYAAGGEYFCVPSEAVYDEYNGPAADERRGWPVQQVWAEYEEAHHQLHRAIETMPADKWDGSMLYPWNERGTVERLIRIMMNHESRDHVDIVLRAASD